MVTQNMDYAAFPRDDTYGMQQAWRLVFDGANVKGTEAYTIEKNYPNEVGIMCERSYKTMGLDIKVPRQDLTPEQKGYVSQKFSELLELSYTNPKTSIAISCVLLATSMTASVFFCRYMLAYMRRVS